MRSAAIGLLLMVPIVAGCATTGPGDDEQGPDPVTNRLGDFVWREHREAPGARTEVTAVVSGPEIWVIGGYDPSGVATRTVQVYDTNDNRWSGAPEYPLPIHHTTAVSVGQRVYVFGGYTTSGFVPTNLSFWFDGRTGTWNATAPLPAPRGAHAAAVVDGTVYLVGGVGLDGQPMTTTHAYDAATDTWSTRAAMPTAREHLTAAAVNGTLYAVGGRQGLLSSNLATVEAYDPAADRWESLPDMPTARGGIASTILLGRVIVVGGEGPDGTFPEIEAYDPANRTWTPLDDNPAPRHGLGSVSARGRLYAMLGGPEPGLTTSGTVVSLGPL